MLNSSSFVVKRLTASVPRKSVRSLSALTLPKTAKNKITDKEDDPDLPSPLAQKMQKMRQADPSLVYGPTGEGVPAAVLPEDPKELTFTDPADLTNPASRFRMDGTPRTIVIRQRTKSARQAPFHQEHFWYIEMDDGSTAEEWTNSLMDWTSSADPYSSLDSMKFNNAAEAVYFAKKRGWNYVVEHPIVRVMGEQGIQYQDNFLPQALANQVKAEGINCREWERSAAGTSHYFRPLNYHGTTTVRQHGPNREASIAKHPEGYYKKR